jgi:CheY-like chemotaxis protein
MTVKPDTTKDFMKDTCPANETSHTSWLRRMFSKPTTDHAATPANASAAKPTRKPANHQKVLVVDDDPLFLKITTTQLEQEGYEVLTAKDGCEAIEAVRKQKPNVVLLDLNLPQDVTGVPWDGFRVITWLKRVEALKNIPIVMMTSSDPSKYTREAIRAGAVGFFSKRLDAKHLLTITHQALTRRGLTPAPAGFDTSFQI